MLPKSRLRYWHRPFTDTPSFGAFLPAVGTAALVPLVRASLDAKVLCAGNIGIKIVRFYHYVLDIEQLFA